MAVVMDVTIIPIKKIIRSYAERDFGTSFLAKKSYI
jgi:hypothetical protein